MTRRLIALFLAVIGLALPAQAQEPRVTFELDAGETLVGQPLTLRIKVLVPTWLPKPAVFPTIEVPSLMVRLPERATGPVSETIDRETWSGVQRAYRLYPLTPGTFTLPGGDVVVTYADPGNPDPIVVNAPLPPLSFTATVPEAARGLDPLIVASGFTLEQTLEGAPEENGDLTVGDAVTRTITARIDGTTPVMIPRLTPDSPLAILRAYPGEPQVTDQENRGDLSGTRVETTSYVGQQAGKETLPGLTLDWYNLETGAVETASLPGFDFVVVAPAGLSRPMDTRDILFWVLVAGLGVVALWGFRRFVWPLLRARLMARRAAYQASEPAAYRRLSRALAARDLTAALARLSDWLAFFPDATAADSSDLTGALARIGATRYGSGPATGHADWAGTKTALTALRARLERHRKTGSSASRLPALNP